MGQIATIYARFSNAEQGRGSSLDRQFRICKEMAERHGWQTDPRRILSDEGRSAFSGSNRQPGGILYEFEQQVEQGLYLNGHVLIVEHLDRISRQGYDEVLPFLTKLTQNGVTIATVDGDRVYPAFERVPMGQVMEVILKAELARDESQKKAKRLAAAWHSKIEKAQTNNGNHVAITSTVPAWLDVASDTKKMTLNEDRVRVLREIFQLTIDGYGTPAIAKRLNVRGEPVWNYRGVRSNNGWTVGYLTKIVLNRAVLGEYRPMKRPRGNARPESKGVVILDYYPQAIDPIMFAKAQAARKERANSSGSWQLSHGNILSGIAKCSECGGRMSQQVTVRKGQLRTDGKRKGRKYPASNDISYLYCANARHKVFDEEAGQLKCSQTSKIRYEPLERIIVDIIAGYAAQAQDSTDPARIRELEIQMAEARRQQEGKRQQAESAARSFVSNGSAIMEKVMLELEGEVAEIDKQLTALEKLLDAERANAPTDDPHAPEQAWFKRVGEIKQQIYSDDEQPRKEARVKMKQIVGRFVSHLSCDRNKETHMILGGAVGMFIGADGAILGTGVVQDEIVGPNGERDWMPDAAE